MNTDLLRTQIKANLEKLIHAFPDIANLSSSWLVQPSLAKLRLALILFFYTNQPTLTPALGK